MVDLSSPDTAKNHQTMFAGGPFKNGQYAIIAPDGSMGPDLLQGDILSIDPARDIEQGNLVYIQLVDGREYVRRYVAKTSKGIVVERLSPRGEVSHSADDVLCVYRVVRGERTMIRFPV